ncbi:MAG: choice-of-anchor L domain-containing protein [Nonlabens sp.]|uniref:choice-of-anchor L domain-containing protein n=1 Tax=Nonlabens sp. TaxID=1888209 RepID=UPI003EF71FE4
MKKAFLIITLLLFYTQVEAQIIVDNTTYTNTELVEDVLVNSTCAGVRNIAWSTGAAANQNGIAYFTHNFSGFPIREGIILSTGNALNAAGPNDNVDSGDTIGTPSDPDLVAAMAAAGSPAATYSDVTWLSFDFVPQAGFISFEFLFASEEYNGDFECSFSDAFAFILTDTITGTVTNLAIVPGTTSPIQVTTVRNPPASATCNPVNPTFFGQYNLLNHTFGAFIPNVGSPAASSPIQFNGQTKIFRAESTVITNRNYNIKLVIADATDQIYDSAVFIAGGSFDVGADLGLDRTLVGGNPLCEGDTYTLDASVAGAALSYQWNRNAVPIAGATNATYTATTTGNYSVNINYTATCSTIASVFLEFTSPASTTPTDMQACGTGGSAVFDLSSKTPEVLGALNPANHIVTYHESQTDAEAGINPIPNPAAYTNTVNPQTVYARVSENTFGCASIEPFDLIISNITAGTPMDMIACDVDNDGLFDFDLSTQDADMAGTNAAGSVNITYHLSQADADAGTGAIGPIYTNTTSPETIYGRVELITDTSCYDTASFDLILNPTPVVPTITDFVGCSTIDANTTIFALSDKDTEILNGQANVAVSYHSSQMDADIGANPLPNGYANVSNPEVVFVRLENTIGNCVSTGTFNLVVNQQPVANATTDLVLCDDATNDGTEVYDLSQVRSDIIGANNPASFIVTFHPTAGDAAANTGSLPDMFSNTTSPQTIFVRLENDQNDTCFDDTITFDLILNETPVAATAPANLELCDDNNPGDGTETFDLTAVAGTITGSQNFADVTISYHTSQNDADMNLAAIMNPAAFDNTSNPQTIFIRLENNTTTCFNTDTSFDLIVNDLPVVTAPSLYDLCDDNTIDGFTAFDLSTKDNEITGGTSGVTVFYYATQLDADNRMNELTGSFTNTVNPQTLFVVVENDTTGCENFTTLDLEVIDAPQAATAQAIILCDDNNTGDLVETFNLTDNEATILNGQSGITLTYHNSQADADSSSNAIGNPTSFDNSSTTQTIYVRVENVTGCFNTTSFDIIVNEVPVPQLFDLYYLCLDENGNILSTDNSPPTLDTSLSAAGLNFSWSLDNVTLPSETGATLTATAVGMYTVTVTNSATSCSSSQTTEVRQLGPPDNFGATVTTRYFDEIHRIEAFANGPATQYIFSVDDGPWQYNGFFNDVSPGPHTVFIQDLDGCNTVEVPVDVIGYPRYFTPNNDGYHDTWNIIGINDEPTTKIYIFDRYGKLLKQMNPDGPGWDGIFNGQPLPSSDYWFQVEYIENGSSKTFGGHFALKR